MMTEEQKNIYGMVLTKTGLSAQVDMTIENMAELTVQIHQMIREQGNMTRLRQSIADVQISLNFLKLIMDEYGDSEKDQHNKEQMMANGRTNI